MADARTIDELRDLGQGRPAPAGVVRLYRQAFADYRALALWNLRQLDAPSIAQALTVAERLRIEGNLNSRRLAVDIEAACRAAL
ncbi:MAG: hypothetical protein AB7K86_01540 [Rhodospirillales bacterium]